MITICLVSVDDVAETHALRSEAQSRDLRREKAVQDEYEGLGVNVQVELDSSVVGKVQEQHPDSVVRRRLELLEGVVPKEDRRFLGQVMVLIQSLGRSHSEESEAVVVMKDQSTAQAVPGHGRTELSDKFHGRIRALDESQCPVGKVSVSLHFQYVFLYAQSRPRSQAEEETLCHVELLLLLTSLLLLELLEAVVVDVHEPRRQNRITEERTGPFLLARRCDLVE